MDSLAHPPLTAAPDLQPSFTHGFLKLPNDPSQITEVNPWALATGVTSVLSYHAEIAPTHALFARPPHWTDINQQSLGNCWFLASISAILCLPDGMDRVLHMMREDRSHVYVRLFDSTNRARYIKLERSVIHSFNGSEYHAQLGTDTGTWTVFLEKALTAFDKERNFSPSDATYRRTSGGFGSRGLALLLGVDTNEYTVPLPTVSPHQAGPMKEFNFNILMLFTGGLDPSQPADLTVLQDVFGVLNTQQCWTDWKAWLNRMKPRNLGEELWPEAARRQEKTRIVWERGTIWDTEVKHTTGVFRLEHFGIWLDRIGLHLAPQLRQAVKDYVRRSGLVPGKRGTGAYSQSQLYAYNRLLGLYQSHTPMTASPRAYVGESAAQKQFTDDKVKGLIPGHEYTISKVYKAGEVCLIQLINPWGKVGRQLGSRSPQAIAGLGGRSVPVVETENACFDLDLDDFTKRFESVFYTATPLPPANQ